MRKGYLLALCAAALSALVLWKFFPTAAREAGPDAIPSGDVRNAETFYSVVFYFSPQPLAATESTARDLAARHFPGVPFTTQTESPPKAPFIAFTEEAAPLKSYPVPDASYFRYAGRGLSAEAIAAIRQTDRATRLFLVAARDEAWKSGRAFTEMAHEFATTCGAVLWDSATRECFSREAWRERRLDPWPPEMPIPDLSQHITIHLYRPHETSRYLRAITLGMEKFALPDVVVEQLVASDNRPVGNLINLVCQSLAENPRITEPAGQRFRIMDVRHEALRQRFQTGLEKGATAEVRLALVPGQPLDGDPENRLIELDFRHASGATTDERREAALSALWGATDSVKDVTHNPAITAASARAREKLPDLRKRFDAGLAPGERLLLKGPFKRDDGGNEWMWVEVMRWPANGTIEGLLQNDPFYIAKLRAGASVKLRPEEVFDYLYYRADGTSEGNETGRLIQQQPGAEVSR